MMMTGSTTTTTKNTSNDEMMKRNGSKIKSNNHHDDPTTTETISGDGDAMSARNMHFWLSFRINVLIGCIVVAIVYYVCSSCFAYYINDKSFLLTSVQAFTTPVAIIRQQRNQHDSMASSSLRRKQNLYDTSNNKSTQKNSNKNLGFCRISIHAPQRSSVLFSPTEEKSTNEVVGSSDSSPATTTGNDELLSDDDETSFRAPLIEINRRRNLAIISHPDSGKTTMTEKLLLYGGALQQAGAVRQKAEQRATASDFMEMEQQRGISISSTVMNFEYEGYGIRLIDTPGHNDFSEDTYRALAAADNALMLLDAAKGLEPQTRKLFEVCRMRQIPLFTFVNKMDRPALSPYEIMDQIESEFQLQTYPIFWPIGDGERFKGVLDRTTNIVHLYTKADKRGGKALAQQVPLRDTDTLKELIDDTELYDKLMEDSELLNELIQPLDIERVLAGEQSPLFFGSAMTNFGVELFLRTFCDMGTRPLGRPMMMVAGAADGGATKDTTTSSTDSNNDDDTTTTSSSPFIDPDHGEFTGFIFKTQANLDPKHRDRLAYVRVVSGTYKKGMKVGHSRSKSNKRYNLAQAQSLFGNDRTSIDVAYPGDVIGINNPGNFAIGDTLYTGTVPVTFPGIPSFSPEIFAYIRAPNPSDYKSFRKGIDQLLDEGAVQALRQRNDDYGAGPLLLAAVGQLQFEVVQARLQNEYNVASIMEPISYTIARWVDGGWSAVDQADADGKLFGTMIVQDRWKRPVVLFRNDWKADSVEKEEQYLQLKPWSYPPNEY